MGIAVDRKDVVEQKVEAVHLSDIVYYVGLAVVVVVDTGILLTQNADDYSRNFAHLLVECLRGNCTNSDICLLYPGRIH
jgi:hypothetical protein